MRKIIIGDVHGCYGPLLELLHEVSPRPEDELIFVGDLIDKGPQSVEVVRHVRMRSTMCKVTVVRGNHEEKFLRWYAKLNKAPEHIQQLAAEMPHELVKFLRQSVVSCRIPDRNAVVVHGGVLPGCKTLPTQEEFEALSKKQQKECAAMLRVRFIRGQDEVQHECRLYDASGARVETIKVNKGNPLPEPPEGGRIDVKDKIKEAGEFIQLGAEKPTDYFWAEKYDGRFGHIYFGHEPFKSDLFPREFRHATGVDLGCVFGNRLCALILEPERKHVITVQSDVKVDFSLED